MQISELIRKLLKAHKMTGEELADKVGITLNTMNIEVIYGNYLSKNMAKKIGDVFGVDLSDYVTKEDDAKLQTNRERINNRIENEIKVNRRTIW